MSNTSKKSIAKSAAKSAKQSKKQTAKSAKQSKKSVLTHEQRSAIARQAAFKAHLHKSFAKKHVESPSTYRKNYNDALRVAPAFVKQIFERI